MFLGLWGFALSNNLNNLQVQAAVPDCPSDSLSDQSILMHLFDGLLPIITLDCIRSISSIAAGLYFSLSVFQGPITGLWCVIVPVRFFRLVILMCLHAVNLWMQTQDSVLSFLCIPCLWQLLQGSSQLFLIGFLRREGWGLGDGHCLGDVYRVKPEVWCIMCLAWSSWERHRNSSILPGLGSVGIVERFSGILVFKALRHLEHPSVRGRLTFILLYTGTPLPVLLWGTLRRRPEKGWV